MTSILDLITVLSVLRMQIQTTQIAHFTPLTFSHSHHYLTRRFHSVSELRLYIFTSYDALSLVSQLRNLEVSLQSNRLAWAFTVPAGEAWSFPFIGK